MMGKMRLLLLVACVGVAVVLAGCGSAGAPDPAKLEGSWVAESFGAAKGLTPVDPGVTSEFTLAAGKVQGLGGVNAFSGGYETPGDNALTFSPIASTMMAGDPKAMDQEQEFYQALEKTQHFEFDGEKLVLSDEGNNTLVVMVPK